MTDKNLLDLVKKLEKFNIAHDKGGGELYFSAGEVIKGVSFDLIDLSLSSKGTVTDEYDNFINNMNRVLVLLSELFSEFIENFGGYQMKVQPKCEACLILLVSAFETYLTEKFCSIVVKLKPPHIKTKLIECTDISLIRINFQNKKTIKEKFKEIGINLLEFYDLDEQKPLSKKEEKEERRWNKTTTRLWEKFFAGDKRNKKLGYSITRHKIIHNYRMSDWGVIDKLYIKNCFLDLVEIVYKFEEKINKKHGDLFHFKRSFAATLNLKDIR